MIQKLTWTNVVDSTGARWVRVFHLYSGFSRRRTYLGYYLKNSVRIVEAPRQEYKGFRFKQLRKGSIVRSLFVRSVFIYKRLDSSSFRYLYNAVILIKKKNVPQSLHLSGPSTYEIRRKKILYLFPFRV